MWSLLGVLSTELCMFMFMYIYNLSPFNSQLEFKEIQRLNGEIEKLGNQVKYLNKKVNTLQDHMREKKVVYKHNGVCVYVHVHVRVCICVHKSYRCVSVPAAHLDF